MPTQSTDPDKAEALEADRKALSDALAIVKRTRLNRALWLRDQLAEKERKGESLGQDDAWLRKGVVVDAELGDAEQMLERLKPPREPWAPIYVPTADPTADLPDDD